MGIPELAGGIPQVASVNLKKFLQQNEAQFGRPAVKEVLSMYFGQLGGTKTNEEFVTDFCKAGLKVLNYSGANHYESRGEIRNALHTASNFKNSEQAAKEAWTTLNDDRSFLEDALFEYFSMIIYRTIISKVVQEAQREGAIDDPDEVTALLTKALCKQRGEEFGMLRKAWKKVVKSTQTRVDFSYKVQHYISGAGYFHNKVNSLHENDEGDESDESGDEILEKKKKYIEDFVDYLHKCFGSCIPNLFSARSEDKPFLKHMETVLAEDLQSKASVDTAFSGMKSWLLLYSSHQDKCFMRHVNHKQAVHAYLRESRYTHLPEIAVNGIGFAYLVRIVIQYCSYLAESRKDGKNGLTRRLTRVFL